MNVMVVGDGRVAARAALEGEPGLHLIDPPGDGALGGAGEIGRIAAALRAFEGRLAAADRVVLVGSSDPALAALLVASKLRIPVVVVATDATDPGGGGSELNRRLIEQLADAVAEDPEALTAWLAAPPPSAPFRGEH